MMTSKKGSGILTLALASTLVAGSAMADNAPSTSTAAATQSTASKIKEKISASLINLIVGPSIAQPTQIYQPDANTGALDRTSPMLFKQYARLGYRANSTTTIGGEGIWSMNAAGGEKNFTVYDPAIRAVKKKMISIGKFAMTGVGRYYVPVTNASRDKNSLGALRVDQSSSISFGGGDKFSLGLDTFQKVNAYSAKATGQKGLSVYAGPNLNYQVTDAVGLGLLYEMSASSRVGDALAFSSDGTDLEPTISWDATSWLNVTGFLDIKTGGRIAADTTQLGAFITITAL